MVKMLPSASLALCLLISGITITPGVSDKVTWVVTMTHHSICAVTGSSVEMPCSFTHHHNNQLIVNKVYWVINAKQGALPPDLKTVQEYVGRVQYKTDIAKTCTLTLSDVRLTDTADYYARIETSTTGEQWLSTKVNLTVKDLFVNTSGPAIEGKNVKLSCKSHCNLIQSSIILWKKNGMNLFDTQTNSHDLELQNIKIEDEGPYYCTVKETNHSSPPLKLNVMYLPKNTSVSVSPAGEIFEGFSVTLTCSSDAKPPVETYTWFRTTSTSAVTSEKMYSLSNISSKHSGLYYCMVKNQYGVGNSTAVRLDVQYAPKNISASVSPSGEIVEGSSVTLTCRSDANPDQSYTWYKKEKSESEMSKISTKQVYSINRVSAEHTGYYYCQSRNKHGHSNYTVTHLDVLYSPKRTSASHNHTGDLEEGSSVTLTCSSDAKPPVENYTWYRQTGDKTAKVGSAETITFTLTSSTAGLYHCEAKNRIASRNSPALKVSLAGSGWQSLVLTAGGAVTSLIVLIVIIAVLMSRRKKNTTNSSSDFSSTARNSQGAADNDYVNVNPATSEPTQNVDLGNQDDVQYASVQFKRSGVQQVPLNSTAQNPKPHTQQQQQQQQQQQDDVEYAAVNFSRHTAATHAGADSDVYSQVSKPRKKKAQGQRTTHQ
ncbi:B-cell receptor CD22-like [Sardina pilchardus]|uniref:B-cell receptor CD22-like n=1 Tax=Sardina pilchardus TaxID=27697 RepID=UPI002E12B43E